MTRQRKAMDAITDWLKSHGRAATVQEIAEGVDVRVPTVRVQLHRAVAAGLVARVDEATYAAVLR